MRIVIFGATGGTGRALVEQALGQRHVVTAFARNPAAITTKHENLVVVKGDVLDYASIERATNNQDAVLSALGSPTLKQNTVLSDGTENIITAMEHMKVRRLICESSMGVGDSKEQSGFFFKRIFKPLFLRHIFADKEVQEMRIRQSQLEWVIVRPAALTNGPRTGVYRHGFPVTDKSLTFKISRADVADFMLKQLTDDTYLRKTPGISY